MQELRNALAGLSGQDAQVAVLGPEGVLAAILMALFVGQALGWIYQRTHSGLSYSMGFTQSLVLLTLGATLLLLVIGGSLVTAFGLLGALAIVRFRNVLKDTRDTVFVFFALILGMAIGTARFGVALGGTAALIGAVTWLQITKFGIKGRFDGHVTYRMANAVKVVATGRVDQVLMAFCRTANQVTLHDTGEMTEVVYAVHLRDPGRASDLSAALRTVPGVDDASVVVRDRLTEL